MAAEEKTLKEQKAEKLGELAAQFGAAPDLDPTAPIPNPLRALDGPVEVDKDTLEQARVQGKRTGSLVPVFKAMFNQAEAEPAAKDEPARKKTYKDVVAKMTAEQRAALGDALADIDGDGGVLDVAAIIDQDEDVQAAYAWLDEEADLEAAGSYGEED
jgi:hypothetical protein